jgi:hypothetical protein
VCELQQWPIVACPRTTLSSGWPKIEVIMQVVRKLVMKKVVQSCRAQIKLAEVRQCTCVCTFHPITVVSPLLSP